MVLGEKRKYTTDHMVVNKSLELSKSVCKHFFEISSEDEVGQVLACDYVEVFVVWLTYPVTSDNIAEIKYQLDEYFAVLAVSAPFIANCEQL